MPFPWSDRWAGCGRGIPVRWRGAPASTARRRRPPGWKPWPAGGRSSCRATSMLLVL